ncbi:hypothetical protein [Nostoc sp.]|uniref:hypothetical protein n=1 Tax=Nostoc sp. TaxID=1180 RepID=UPI002FF45A66
MPINKNLLNKLLLQVYSRKVTGLWHSAWRLIIASQSETETEALANLEETLSLHFEPLVATIIPHFCITECLIFE